MKEKQKAISSKIKSVMSQEEIMEIANKSSQKLKAMGDELLETTIYPLDESISFLQGLNAKIFFNNSNNFLAKLPNNKVKRELKQELDNQLKLYLEATKIYTLIMRLSKGYYEDISAIAQDEYDDFKKIELQMNN